MPVPARHGTTFYEFGDAEQTHALTRAFRNGLACVVADPATVSALADEARHAFELRSRLFDELACAFKLGEKPAAEPMVALGSRRRASPGSAGQKNAAGLALRRRS